jgi:broad specificity phosphatase PhoE
MKIYIMRHGQSTTDIEERYGGEFDDHLTDKGKIQAEELGKNLLDKQIETIYHSPLLRAKETAFVVQRKTKSQIYVVPEFKERNTYGILTGMIKKDAQKTYPQLIALLTNEHNVIPDAESYNNFRERVMKGFDTIVQTDAETIAIVTHGGPMKLLFNELLDRKIKTVEDCGYVLLEKHKKELSIRESHGILYA